MSGGAKPCGVGKADAFELDIADGVLGSAYDLDERLKGRHGGHELASGLVGQGIVVNLVGVGVVIPFAWLVEQLHGVHEVEGRGMARVGCHGRRPGVLELHAALWLVEGDGHAVALGYERADAQHRHAPHFVEHHFETLRHRPEEAGRYAFLGYPQDLVLFVYGPNAGHLLKVAHVAGTGGLAVVHP